MNIMAALPPSPYMPSQLASNRKTTLGPSRQLASSKRPDIYARNLQRTRTAELSNSAMAFLFSELVQHVQKQVSGIQDLERKLNEHGYRVGQRALELFVWREKNSKRETKVLGILQFVSSSLWKNLFGRQADALEKSREKEDEYMVIDNDPIINRFISVPKEMNQLNCAAFVAGIVEAVLDGSQFPCRVTAHSVATDAFPNRTVILIKLDQSVLERERQLYSH